MEEPRTAEKAGPVLFVAEEVKPDWRTGGRAHPILSGECLAATGWTVELVTFEELMNPFLRRPWSVTRIFALSVV